MLTKRFYTQRDKNTHTHNMPRITCTGSPDGGGTVGCGAVLVHPPSASFVRCAVCSAITPCRPIVSGKRRRGRSRHHFSNRYRRRRVFGRRSSRGSAPPGFGGRFGVGSSRNGRDSVSRMRGATDVRLGRDAGALRVVSHREQSRFGGFGGGSAQRQDVSHCQCRGCGVTLMYTRGATSVSCGACHAITNTAGIVAEREGERWSKAALGKRRES